MDEGAAKLLKEADYYWWLFKNDARWRAWSETVGRPDSDGAVARPTATLRGGGLRSNGE